MARKSKHSGRGLGRKETQFLHLKEFSQGKPNELSLNVLEQKAAAQDEPSRSAKWQLPAFGKSSSSEEKEKPRKAEKKAPSKKREKRAAKTRKKAAERIRI